MRIFTMILASALLLYGCAKEEPKQKIGSINPGVARHWDVGDEKLRHPLPPEMGDGFLEFSKAPGFNFGLTLAHDKISPRSHERHDMIMYVHWGSGRFHIGDKDFHASAGDVMYVPRGTVYSAARTGNLPLELLTVFQPPFNGDDVVYEDSEDSESVIPKTAPQKKLQIQKKIVK